MFSCRFIYYNDAKSVILNVFAVTNSRSNVHIYFFYSCILYLPCTAVSFFLLPRIVRAKFTVPLYGLSMEVLIAFKKEEHFTKLQSNIDC